MNATSTNEIACDGRTFRMEPVRPCGQVLLFEQTDAGPVQAGQVISADQGEPIVAMVPELDQWLRRPGNEAVIAQAASACYRAEGSR